MADKNEPDRKGPLRSREKFHEKENKRTTWGKRISTWLTRPQSKKLKDVNTLGVVSWGVGGVGTIESRLLYVPLGYVDSMIRFTIQTKKLLWLGSCVGSLDPRNK